MSLDSALSAAAAPPTNDEGAAPLAAPRRTRLFGPRSAQELQVFGSRAPAVNFGSRAAPE
jgi:hypothetical protein